MPEVSAVQSHEMHWGDQYVITPAVTDAAGVAQAVTGKAFTATFRKNDWDGAVIATKTTAGGGIVLRTQTGGDVGKLDVTLLAADTTTLLPASAPSALFYDVKNVTDNVVTERGTILVHPVSTQA